MATPFLKSFDDLLNSLLVDYGNLDPSPDTTIGSIVWIKGAVLASALWGIYKYQDYLANQPFPDTCDTNNLNHFGSIFGIARIPGENDNDYSNRIIGFMKSPPAGGTAQDYVNWALATSPQPANLVENFLPSDVIGVPTGQIQLNQLWQSNNTCKFSSTGALPAPLNNSTVYGLVDNGNHLMQVWDGAYTSPIPLTSIGTGVHTMIPQSPTLYNVALASCISPPLVPAGQTTTVILPNDETILGDGAMATLVIAVSAYIEARRPVTASLNQVLAAQPVYIDVDINVNPVLADTQTMKIDIQNFMNSMKPGDTLYQSKLEAICIQDGAINASVAVPGTDTVPSIYQVIRAGNITVSAA